MQARISENNRKWRKGQRRYADHIDLADAFLQRVGAQSGDAVHRMVEMIVAAPAISRDQEIAKMRAFRRFGKQADLDAVMLPLMWRAMRPLLKKPSYDVVFEDALQASCLAMLDYLLAMDLTPKQAWSNLVGFIPKTARSECLINAATPLSLPQDRSVKSVLQRIDAYAAIYPSLQDEMAWDNLRQHLKSREQEETSYAFEGAFSPVPIQGLPEDSYDPTPLGDLRLDVARLADWARTALPKREVFILEKLHLKSEPDTLAEIGEALSLSAERIRQIDRDIMKKLKAAWLSDLKPDFQQSPKSTKKNAPGI